MKSLFVYIFSIIVLAPSLSSSNYNEDQALKVANCAKRVLENRQRDADLTLTVPQTPMELDGAYLMIGEENLTFTGLITAVQTANDEIMAIQHASQPYIAERAVLNTLSLRIAGLVQEAREQGIDAPLAVAVPGLLPRPEVYEGYSALVDDVFANNDPLEAIAILTASLEPRIQSSKMHIESLNEYKRQIETASQTLREMIGCPTPAELLVSLAAMRAAGEDLPADEVIANIIDDLAL